MNEYPPSYPTSLTDSWERTLDRLAAIFKVPAALIMRVHEDQIEVYVKSANSDNPYELHEFARLHTGLYCEWVMNHRKMLHVPNALKDLKWDTNPDIKLGMINYAGLPILTPAGEVFGTICVLDRKEKLFSPELLDTLEEFRNLIQIDMELYDSKIKAEKLSQENEELINILCHDLINPIGVAQSYLDLIKLSDTGIESINLFRIKTALQTSMQIIDDVRELKMGGRESLSKKIQGVNLSQSVKKSIDSVLSTATEKNISINNRVDPEIRVLSEINSLTSAVITNLLINAIKFSHPNSKVDISSDENEHSVSLHVRDYGIGMPKEVTEHLFSGRGNISRPGTLGESGTGFGLRIVKKFMNIYPGGNISVHSCETSSNRGTEVKLQFKKASV